jgi:Transposase
MALERLRTCRRVGELCKELGIHHKTLRRWQMQEAGYEPSHAVSKRAEESLQQENERLKRALAEKTLEVDFLQGASGCGNHVRRSHRDEQCHSTHRVLDRPRQEDQADARLPDEHRTQL